MSDSEEYSSAEDEDYVPSGEEYSEDDVSELVKEDEDEEKPYKEKGKKSSKGTVCRKRERGGLLLLPGEREESKDQQSDSEEADSLRQVKGSRAEEEEKKKKEDALWASFLSDVGQKSKAPPAAQLTSPQTNKTTEEKSSSKLQEEAKEPAKPKDMAKVTITKVFDFAGEEVRVTKEVDAASKEAKSFLKQQEKEKAQPAAPASLPTVSGYIDRKAFLERVDHRQFEIERDIRLSKTKP
ncbi:craniofacial development protein 1 isoform X6 [Dermochelys coriacea]|uniref:craniofacial development protein 1 isoform X6 n=1 Tax=Dermochelys coriacea TaxID=27794 RepID=UPI0018E79FAE|nr:craniofacial development protein 1 isoform X6 [Dermochelys coriacea]